MILPDKNFKENETLLGVGAELLRHLKTKTNLSSLWDRVKKNSNIGTYERFILGLDLLFILGVLEFKNNQLVRTKNDL